MNIKRMGVLVLTLLLLSFAAMALGECPSLPCDEAESFVEPGRSSVPTCPMISWKISARAHIPLVFPAIPRRARPDAAVYEPAAEVSSNCTPSTSWSSSCPVTIVSSGRGASITYSYAADTYSAANTNSASGNCGSSGSCASPKTCDGSGNCTSLSSYTFVNTNSASGNCGSSGSCASPKTCDGSGNCTSLSSYTFVNTNSASGNCGSSGSCASANTCSASGKCPTSQTSGTSNPRGTSSAARYVSPSCGASRSYPTYSVYYSTPLRWR